jgi:hypothetical protein
MRKGEEECIGVGAECFPIRTTARENMGRMCFCVTRYFFIKF